MTAGARIGFVGRQTPEGRNRVAAETEGGGQAAHVRSGASPLASVSRTIASGWPATCANDPNLNDPPRVIWPA
jgi:hypothetical protein